MNIASSLFDRRAPLAAALAISIAIGGSASAAFAQDGTGAATPTPPSSCELVPAAWTGETTEATPVATPSSGTIPVTFINGSPDATETDTTAADPLTQDLEAASVAITGCLSDARYDTLVRITGDDYRGSLIGFGMPLSAEDFAVFATALPAVNYQIISVENATATSDTTATADVTYELSHQVRLSTWTFELQEIDGQSVWTLQSETSMTPVAPEGTDTMTVTIGAEGYTIADARVQGPSVAIEASNSDTVDHEILVLRLSADVTTDALLTNPGPALPEGVTYIGQATVPAGSSGTLLLAGLQPGTYTIVDLLPNASGLPNLSDGMEITFDVE